MIGNMRYVQRNPPQARVVLAAQYRAGQPFDDVLDLARGDDPGADAVEVPAWKVLLIRTTRFESGERYTGWTVIKDGEALCYDRRNKVFYTLDGGEFEEFLRDYAPATGFDGLDAAEEGR